MASVARSVRRRRQLEDWKALPWRSIQRNVFRLQQRIYQAENRGEYKQVHNLQRLLLSSWSARCLAVRRVSQDNRGKCAPGVDGVANLTLKQRLALIEELRNVSNWQADAAGDQPVEETEEPLWAVWAILRGRGRDRGTSLGWGSVEQSLCQSGVTPRPLSR